ncbi:MAG: DUF805 domain-containing protein [Alphaproteobacteria bacterium]|nr:DUF805 domain-containing protein [Alphaproteobacteria bacterium]MBV9695045.1 DUF805 domain-containing protein [Alphaproteobacteria bacterium]
MWLFFAVAVVFEFVALALAFLTYAIVNAMGIVQVDPDTQTGSPAFGKAIFIAGLTFFVAIYGMYFAVGIKRLHDRNRSGWWILPFYVVPTAAIGLAEVIAPADGPSPSAIRMILAAVFAVVGLGLSVWGFVEMYFLRGTRGANRFGPDPMAPPASPHAADMG